MKALPLYVTSVIEGEINPAYGTSLTVPLFVVSRRPVGHGSRVDLWSISSSIR